MKTASHLQLWPTAPKATAPICAKREGFVSYRLNQGSSERPPPGT